MNTAVRNSQKLGRLAAGKNSSAPATCTNSETTSVVLAPIDSISFDVGEETIKYAVKNAPFASAACSQGRSNTDRKCGTSCMFRLVINPKMKYRIVTVIN